MMQMVSCICILYYCIAFNSLAQGFLPSVLFGSSRINQIESPLFVRINADRLSTSLHASISPSWTSSISTNDNLDQAIDEAIAAATLDSTLPYNVALFFVSSIYEASAFQYQAIFKSIHEKLPSVTHVIGCTTGAVIGPFARAEEPLEVEARSSISIMLANIDESQDITAETVQMSLEQVISYIESGTKLPESSSSPPGSSGSDGKVLFLMATDTVKSRLSDLVTSLETKEGITAFGAVASSVTSLHTPKVFISTDRGPMQKLTSGLVGLYLKGDIAVETIVARSCKPIGPLFSVKESNGREIMSLSMAGPDGVGEPEPPLVQLDKVLNMLPPAQADALKRELLIGLIPKSIDELRGSVPVSAGMDSMSSSDDFFGQKPTAFDPFTGSITVPCLPPSASFQFCMRDTPSARLDLAKASGKLGQALGQSDAYALLLLGSMERGNKVFRFSSWESKQVYSQLVDSSAEKQVPVSGFFSAGTFAKISDAMGVKTLSALMETDALYAVLSRKSTASSTPVTGITATSLNADYCTPSELDRFSDRADMVIVSKRDPESAAPVKVASMDYVIPEKAPQPSSVLESLVWERERDVDRMRERFQLARALSLAKAAEGKFKKRDYFGLLLEARAKLEAAGGVGKPLVVEFVRDSLYNGRLGGMALYEPDEALQQVQKFGADMRGLMSGAGSIGALGCQVDFSTFRGSYEDIEELRRSTDVPSDRSPLPIMCSDFIVYAYQLFKAKSSGTDAVKLMASVLSVQGASVSNILFSLLPYPCVALYLSPLLFQI